MSYDNLTGSYEKYIEDNCRLSGRFIYIIIYIGKSFFMRPPRDRKYVIEHNADCYRRYSLPFS